MIRVLVSSCLLGQPVRYNGSAKRYDHSILARWRQENRLVPFCPEVEAGLSVPRLPAEIVKGDGFSVLDHQSNVIDQAGQDVTQLFLDGARKTVEAALKTGAKLAVLTDGSPSCGNSYLHDGTFSSVRIAGVGVTAALLERSGVRVFSQTQVEMADEYLYSLIKIEEAKTCDNLLS